MSPDPKGAVVPPNRVAKGFLIAAATGVVIWFLGSGTPIAYVGLAVLLLSLIGWAGAKLFLERATTKT